MGTVARLLAALALLGLCVEALAQQPLVPGGQTLVPTGQTLVPGGQSPGAPVGGSSGGPAVPSGSSSGGLPGTRVGTPSWGSASSTGTPTFVNPYATTSAGVPPLTPIP